MLSLFLPIVEQKKLLVWVWMVWQLWVGKKDLKDRKESEEEGKDEYCDGNALTINSESKVAKVVVLSVDGLVIVSGEDKTHKRIIIDCSVLPTNPPPKDLLSKVIVKTFTSLSLSFPSHLLHLSCQFLATNPSKPKRTTFYTLLLEAIVPYIYFFMLVC